MIYAVIKTGGKQEKVVPGQRVSIERLRGTSTDDSVSFEPLLVVREGGEVIHGDAAGKIPVEARVVGEARGKKIQGFKYKSKSGYRRRWGHRQELTVIEVTSIGDVSAEDFAKAQAKAEKQAEAKAETQASAEKAGSEAEEPVGDDAAKPKKTEKKAEKETEKAAAKKPEAKKPAAEKKAKKPEAKKPEAKKAKASDGPDDKGDSESGGADGDADSAGDV